MTYIQLNIIMVVCRNQVMKKKLRLDYVEQIKVLKNWSHTYAPSLIEPALSYALDWLSPELLGTGFKIKSIFDTVVVAKIPFKKVNCDYQGQIHLGLVTNAASEIINVFISRHWPKQSWLITELNVSIDKKLSWNADLEMALSIFDHQVDTFLVELQKNKSAEFELEVSVKPLNQNKQDCIKFKLTLIKTNILS